MTTISTTDTNTTVQRNSDILAVVNAADHSQVTAEQISEFAAKNIKDFPHYKPDGAGAILIFHAVGLTDTNATCTTFVLGGIRENPALTGKFVEGNTPFPRQINTSIGGHLPDPKISLREATVNAIKEKMFVNSILPDSCNGAKTAIKELCEIIENENDWEAAVCIHTDQWKNGDGTIGTMCYLTTVKHIRCKDVYLTQIQSALQAIIDVKKMEGANLRTLSEFTFVPLNPVIQNSISLYEKDEEAKATIAYMQYKNEATVAFNDLSVATLKQNGAFDTSKFVKLIVLAKVGRRLCLAGMS